MMSTDNNTPAAHKVEMRSSACKVKIPKEVGRSGETKAGKKNMIDNAA